MGKVQCILVLFLVWCAAFSCTYPLSSESFVRVSDRDDAGRYVFSLDMSDSAAVYTINFFTRLDCDDNMFAGIGDIAIDVLVESPGHRKYSERVYLPASDIQKRNYFTKDYDVIYRERFSPAEAGVWTMYLSVPDETELTGLRGIGTRIEKIPYGKR